MTPAPYIKESVPSGNNADLLIVASTGDYCGEIAGHRFLTRLQLVCDPLLLQMLRVFLM